MISEMGVHELIDQVCAELATFLTEKNKRYGNSALSPLSVFNKLVSVDSLFVRVDDKLSRIKNSDQLRKNDVVDLMGYLILICIERGWICFEDLID